MSNSKKMRGFINLMETVEIDEAEPLPRNIPAGSMKVQDKQSSAVVYTYTKEDGKPVAVAFRGRAGKASWHFRFRDEARREEKIREFFDDVRSGEEDKRERAASRKGAERGVDVGDILYTSWGYEQTNIDFYQVVALVGKSSVKLREIDQDVGSGGEGSSSMSGQTSAIKDSFKGPETTVRVANGRAKVEGHYASLWDGKPKYVSWYA